MRPIDWPRARLNRAAEHIQEFDVAVRQWYDSKPLRIIYEQFNADQTAYIYRFKFAPIPARIGIIAGDALHNLRASLDYLTWQLALKTTEHPSRKTAFPICLRNDDESQRHIKSLLKNVPDEARKIIKSFQPYHTGDDLEPQRHVLWLLHNLSIIDKHQFITVWGEWHVALKDGMTQNWLNKNTIEITILVVDKNLPPPPPEVSYDLSFGQKLFILGIRADILSKIHDGIRDVVLPSFDRFLL
jgi:hypothetical protein